MAMISLAGTVTGGKDGVAVSVKEFEGGDKLANFSIADRQYFYSKDPDKKGQFYNVQLRGKAAEIAADRISKGDKIAVTGQLVQRDYNGKTYIDVVNAQVTYLEPRRENVEEDVAF